MSRILQQTFHCLSKLNSVANHISSANGEIIYLFISLRHIHLGQKFQDRSVDVICCWVENYSIFLCELKVLLSILLHLQRPKTRSFTANLHQYPLKLIVGVVRCNNCHNVAVVIVPPLPDIC